MSDRAVDALRELAAEVVREAIEYHWLYGTAEPRVDVRLSTDQGGTDAVILAADVRLRLFAKFHPHDVQSEAQGYRVLRAGPDQFAEHLVPPLSSNGSPIFWLTPLIDAATLHDLTFARRSSRPSDQFLYQLYDDFLNAEETLWTATRTSETVDLSSIYGDRVSGDRFMALAAVLRDDLHMEIPDLLEVTLEVKDSDFSRRIGDVLSDFEARLAKTTAPAPCTIHGDDHAKNIMVRRSGYDRDPRRWMIIDYVTARSDGDWLYSVAKMLQWWDFYCVLEMAKKQKRVENALQVTQEFERSSNRLIIGYDRRYLRERVPRICRDLQQMVLQRTGDVAQRFGESDSQRQERLKLALFSVVFGSAHRQVGKAKFALPIMLGKSIEYLYDGIPA